MLLVEFDYLYFLVFHVVERLSAWFNRTPATCCENSGSSSEFQNTLKSNYSQSKRVTILLLEIYQSPNSARRVYGSDGYTILVLVLFGYTGKNNSKIYFELH